MSREERFKLASPSRFSPACITLFPFDHAATCALFRGSYQRSRRDFEQKEVSALRPTSKRNSGPLAPSPAVIAARHARANLARQSRVTRVKNIQDLVFTHLSLSQQQGKVSENKIPNVSP
jgi:hypothetical protein